MPIPKRGETGLVIIPPKRIVARINKWRKIYDDQPVNILAHITVIYPFISLIQWSTASSQVIDCLSEFHIFHISFQEPSFFVGHPFVLWLKPDHNPELRRIHNTLYRRFSKYLRHSNHTYRPHMAIGFYDSRKELSAALQSTKVVISKLDFDVRNMWFGVYDDKTASWRELEKLPIGK